jgi:hypothetical protein
MTIIQIRTSKNPSSGAIFFLPLETKIILIVPIDTSQIRAKNIMTGSTIKPKVFELKNEVSIDDEF